MSGTEQVEKIDQLQLESRFHIEGRANTEEALLTEFWSKI
jgi:hypothetical protein